MGAMEGMPTLTAEWDFGGRTPKTERPKEAEVEAAPMPTAAMVAMDQMKGETEAMPRQLPATAQTAALGQSETKRPSLADREVLPEKAASRKPSAATEAPANTKAGQAERHSLLQAGGEMVETVWLRMGAEVMPAMDVLPKPLEAAVARSICDPTTRMEWESLAEREGLPLRLGAVAEMVETAQPM